MGRKLVSLAKGSTALYALYYVVGTIFIRTLKLFVRPNPHLILFVSYGGRQYSDSPKAIYEEILKDRRFDNFELMWAFRSPEAIQLPGRGKKIKIDSIPYYKIALGARVWITNVAIERGLNFKGKHTFYLCTWHGSPIKKLWFDLKEHGAKVFVPKNPVNFDMLCAQSPYDVEVFSSAFRIDKSKIVMTGLPRNDVLVNPDESIRRKTRKDLGIKDDQIMVLYAPTYRDYDLEEPIFHPELWHKELADNIVLCYKGHHFSSKEFAKQDYPNVKRISSNIEISNLMIASDALISDYSSVFFDYSILNRPMFCYAPDLERYKQERGLYVDFEDLFLGTQFFTNELNIIEDIYNYFRSEAFQMGTIKIKYKQQCGDASKILLGYIINQIA